MRKFTLSLVVLVACLLPQVSSAETPKYKRSLYVCSDVGKPGKPGWLWYRYPVKGHSDRDKRDNGKVVLIWEDVGRAHSVKIKYWRKGKKAKTVIHDDNAKTTIGNLKNGKKYHFKLKGISNCGEGPYSKELVVFP